MWDEGFGTYEFDVFDFSQKINDFFQIENYYMNFNFIKTSEFKTMYVPSYVR